MNVRETLEMLQSPAAEQLLARLYGPEHAEENRKRYAHVAEKFAEEYGDKDLLLFTSPGRTEKSWA